MGKILGERLETMRRHRFVGDVRGLGLMWGIEIVRDRKSREPYPATLKVARRLYDACLAEGLLVYPGAGTRMGRDGDHILIGPPFTITRAEIDELASRLDRALRRLGSEL